jgi:hypothetical protein
MLISTDLPNDEERASSLEAIPWRSSLQQLVGEISASFDNNALDLIDASIGPSHSRAALVALLDGAGALRSATISVAESVLREKVFRRVATIDPLNPAEPLSAKDSENLTLIYTRLAIEDAAVRVASAADHLANAHVRSAWEANAATLREVIGCGFDPAKAEPERWISAPQLRSGILKARRDGLISVLPGFVPNRAFLGFMDNEAVQKSRSFRDEVVHRERPVYREVPYYARTTLWVQPSFSINFPRQEQLNESAPTFDERRHDIGAAIVETMHYVRALWEHTKLWLPSIEVWITPTPDKKVKITTRHQISGQSPRFPRGNRDPGPFLHPW